MKKPFVVIRLKKWHLLLVLALIVLILGSISISRGATVMANAHLRDVVSGKKIVIDAGHGGVDGGAIGKGGLVEKEVNLAVAKELKTVLNRDSMYTIMTRETDTDLLAAEEDIVGTRKRQELTRRVELAEANEADMFISIHANSFPQSQWSGAQVFYNGKSAESKLLAELIQAELVSSLGNNTRKAKTGDFFLLNNLEMPAVLIEIGFLSNPQEEKLLGTPEYQEKIAEAIGQGIKNFYLELEKRGGIVSPTAVEGEFGIVTKVVAYPEEVVEVQSDIITLYMGGADNFDDKLITITMEIPGFSELGKEEMARAVLEQLLAGPGEGNTFKSVIPEGTVLRGLRLEKDVIYVNFSSEFVKNHSGGASGEMMTVYSVVNTLTQLPYIKSVKILVEGEEIDTLAGHLDLHEPIGANVV